MPASAAHCKYSDSIACPARERSGESCAVGGGTGPRSVCPPSNWWRIRVFRALEALIPQSQNTHLQQARRAACCVPRSLAEAARLAPACFAASAPVSPDDQRCRRCFSRCTRATAGKAGRLTLGAKSTLETADQLHLPKFRPTKGLTRPLRQPLRRRTYTAIRPSSRSRQRRTPRHSLIPHLNSSPSPSPTTETILPALLSSRPSPCALHSPSNTPCSPSRPPTRTTRPLPPSSLPAGTLCRIPRGFLR